MNSVRKEALTGLEVRMSRKELYYMSLAQMASYQSKDPTTKVGSCIVKDGKVLSLGWNGPPRSIDDSLVPFECRDITKPLKEQKYPYIVHAEMNAVLNYGGSLSDLVDSTLYVTVSPCHDCAKMLSQLKIKEVVYIEEYQRKEMWDMSKYMFDCCGVKYRKLEIE